MPFDSTTLKIGDVTDSTTTMYLYDYRTRRQWAARTIGSNRLEDFTRVGNAWAWIPNDGSSIQVRGDDAAGPRPGSPNGDKIAFMGFQAPNEDSLGVGILSLNDGTFSQAYTTFAEGGGTSCSAPYPRPLRSPFRPT